MICWHQSGRLLSWSFSCSLLPLIGGDRHTSLSLMAEMVRPKGKASLGFQAIGSGAGNAMFWLAHRAHTLGMRPLRALYHAYEAKVMAEDARNVNDQIDILAARADANWSCSSHATAAELEWIPEFPLDSLKDLMKKYGPRATDDLDSFPDRLIKQQSDFQK